MKLIHDENGLPFNPCLDDVKEVSAFRRDLVTVDQVFLVVKLTSGTALLFNEDLADYSVLRSWLGSHLPDFEPQYDSYLRQPPFEARPHTFYQADPIGNSCNQP